MELIHSYLEGSDAAFERLYNRYRRPLYGYLRSMLAPADADDVFQQTWVRACAALPGYRCRGKFQAWLFRIGRNLALDAIRRTARRRKIEAEDKTAADPPAARESEPGGRSTMRSCAAGLTRRSKRLRRNSGRSSGCGMRR